MVDIWLQCFGLRKYLKWTLETIEIRTKTGNKKITQETVGMETEHGVFGEGRGESWLVSFGRLERSVVKSRSRLSAVLEDSGRAGRRGVRRVAVKTTLVNWYNIL